MLRAPCSTSASPSNSSTGGGSSYTLSGLFKDNGSANTWAEMYLLDKPPVPGKDVVDMNGKVDFTTATVVQGKSSAKESVGKTDGWQCKA